MADVAVGGGPGWGSSTLNGIKDLDELVRLGWSTGEIRRAVAAGRLVRLRRGQYAVAEGLTPWAGHARLAAGVARSTGAGAALSHESAAVLWGIAVSPQRLDRVHLTRLDGGHGKTIGGAVHHAGPLRADEWTVSGTLRATSAPRTAVDVARSAPYEWGVAAMDSTLHRRLTSRAELEDSLGRARGRRGVARARAALAFADQAAESPLESVSRVQLSELGFPPPELQYELRDGLHFVARFDFAWPVLRLAGEADGAEKYDDSDQDGSGVEALLAEKRRAEWARDLGWTLVRWDFDVLRAPGRFERRMRASFDKTSGRRHAA